MARGVWLLTWLQMYRPPALNRSVSKVFCQLDIHARTCDVKKLYSQRATVSLCSPYTALLNKVTSPKECARFCCNGRVWASTPYHVSVYNAAIFFIFLAILTFVNLFVDNNNIVLHT